MEGVHTATQSWVLDVTGSSRILSEHRLVGGWTSDIRLLRIDGPDAIVLRRLYREPWVSHAAALLTREADVLKLLEHTAVPAPRLLGLDADAGRADAPALLMTRVEGSLVLEETELVDRLPKLAELLLAIHRIDPQNRPRDWESWAVEERRRVPPWSSSPASWTRAFAAIDGPPPAHDCVFPHRDFHPGNVLWNDDVVTGVVDWVETSWGPAALDIAHCCTALAMLCGPATAHRFGDEYCALAGVTPPGPYWQLIDIVGFLPDPGKVVGPWREAGRSDLSIDLARARLESYLDDILEVGDAHE